MKITTCSDRPLLKQSTLDNIDFQMDTYIGCEHYCHYCYVLRGAETDWRKEVRVHHDMANRLSNELRSIKPQQIFMGYYSDPYQPCESDVKQTRQALKVLEKNGFSVSILTKSDLVLRDIDILKKMDGAAVSVSLAINDGHSRSIFEEKTVDTKYRIQALSKLKASGIRTGVLLCPVIPYITETMELLWQASKHADTIWIYRLSANSEDPSDRGWLNTRDILGTHFPELAEEIESAVMSKDHPYWEQLRNEIVSFAQGRELDLRVHV